MTENPKPTLLIRIKASYLTKENNMPGNNYNYGASYIMGADKTSVDANMGETQLTRQGLEFDTRAQTGVLTEDMPKQQTKTTVDPSVMNMAEERDY